MKNLSLLTVGLVAVAVPAMADSWYNPMSYAPSKPADAYVSVRGGWTKPEDQKFGGGNVSFDNGAVESAAFGGRYGSNRMELEALHTSNDVKDINGVNGSGKSQLYAGMVNGYHDFKNSSYWTPYVGVGAGYGRVNFKDYAGGGMAANGGDSVLAYQGMAGVSYEFNPCWSFNAEYRRIGTTNADVTTAAGVNTSQQYNSNNVLAGVTYHF